MIPRYCKDCTFFRRELIPHPNGKNYQTMYLCSNVNCSDPVDASPIPCGIARKEDILCGLKGRFFQPVAPKLEPEETKIIQLETK